MQTRARGGGERARRRRVQGHCPALQGAAGSAPHENRQHPCPHSCWRPHREGQAAWGGDAGGHQHQRLQRELCKILKDRTALTPPTLGSLWGGCIINQK